MRFPDEYIGLPTEYIGRLNICSEQFATSAGLQERLGLCAGSRIFGRADEVRASQHSTLLFLRAVLGRVRHLPLHVLPISGERLPSPGLDSLVPYGASPPAAIQKP